MQNDIKKTIVITRPRPPSDQLVAQLSEFEIIHIPVIRVKLRTGVQAASQLTSLELGEYCWLIFTSQYGVSGFIKNYENRAIPSQLKIATVGHRTAAYCFEKLGRKADFIPKYSSVKNLIEELQKISDKKARWLLIQGSQSDRIIANPRDFPDLDRLVVYETEVAKADVSGLLSKVSNHCVIAVCSPSAVDGIMSAFEHSPKFFYATKFVSIGPTTTEYAEKCGLRVSGQAATPSEVGLIEAIKRVQFSG